MPDINEDAFRLARLKHLETFFPAPSHPEFLVQVHQNLTSGSRESSFSIFMKEMKRINPKFRKYGLFLFWLFLCLRRPWKSEGFPSGRLRVKSADMENIITILMRLKERYGADFPDSYPGERTVRAHVKRGRFESRYAYMSSSRAIAEAAIKKLGPGGAERILEMIRTALLKGLREGPDPFELLELEKKLCRLLTNAPFIKLRDLQRRLHWNAELCRAVVGFAETQGWIRIKRLPHDSAWVFLKEKRLWVPTPDYMAILSRFCLPLQSANQQKQPTSHAH